MAKKIRYYIDIERNDGLEISHLQEARELNKITEMLSKFRGLRVKFQFSKIIE